MKYENKFSTLVLCLLIGSCASERSDTTNVWGNLQRQQEYLVGQFPEASPLLAERTPRAIHVDPHVIRVESPSLPHTSVQGAHAATLAKPAVRVDFSVTDAALFKVFTQHPKVFNVSRVGFSTLTATADPNQSVAVLQSADQSLQAWVYATERGVHELWRLPDSREVGYEVDLPSEWTLSLVEKRPAIVEIKGPSGVAWARVRFDNAWDNLGESFQPEISLRDNRVILEGLQSHSPPFLIDPEWQSTTTPLFVREAENIETLPNGKVLYAGGATSTVAELYDPETGTFTATARMGEIRYGAASSIIEDGRVIISGGADIYAGEFVASVTTEFYDYRTEKFSNGPALQTGNFQHKSIALSGNKVLVFGGFGVNPEIIDLTNNSTHYTTVPIRSSYDSVLSRITNQRALVQGINNDNGPSTLWALDFDAASESFSLRDETSFNPAMLTTQQLPGGDFLVLASDLHPDGSTPGTTFRYHPTNGKYEYLSGPDEYRQGAFATTLLPDGMVALVTASYLSPETSASFDYFDDITNDHYTNYFLPGILAVRDLRTLPSGQVLATVQQHAALLFSPPPSLDIHSSLTHQSKEGALLTLKDGRVVLVGHSFYAGGATGDTVVSVKNQSNAQFVELARIPVEHVPATVAQLSDGRLLISNGTRVSTRLDIVDINQGNHEKIIANNKSINGYCTIVSADDQVFLIGGTIDGEFQSDILVVDLKSGQTNTWGTLLEPRWGPRCHVIEGDKVLVFGGTNYQTPITSIELLDLSNHTVAKIGELNSARDSATSVVLENNSILVAAGYSIPPDRPKECEIILPTGEVIAGPTLPSGRVDATSVLLKDGRVLIAGGGDDVGGLTEALIYNPQDNSLKKTNPMGVARARASSALDSDGNVIVIGGGYETEFDFGYYEVFDVQTEQFSAPSSDPPQIQSAPILISGDEYITHAKTLDGELGLYLYRPSRDVAPTLVKVKTNAEILSGQSISVLPTGAVVLVGGSKGETASNAVEVIDPHTGDRIAAHKLLHARSRHTTTVTPDGSIVVIGGVNDGVAIGSVELVNVNTGSVSEVGTLNHPRFGHSTTIVEHGELLIIAGQNEKGEVTQTAEVVIPLRNQIKELAEIPVASNTLASYWPAGNSVFFVSDDFAGLLDSQTGVFRSLGGFSGAPVSIVPFATLDTWVCTAENCFISDFGIRSLTSNLPADFYTQSFAVPSVESDLTIQLTDHDKQAFGTAYIHGRSTLPPWIDKTSVPTQLQPNTNVVIRGERFKHIATRNSEGLKEDLGVHPLVVFRPTENILPYQLPVLSSTDTSIEFRVDSRAYRGSGTLHIVIQGVASDGIFTSIGGQKTGTSCSDDFVCDAGLFCADGVCCDRLCTNPCEACTKALRGNDQPDGVCGPVLKNKLPKEQDACSAEPSGTCGRTGLCDGNSECAKAPDDDPCQQGGTCQQGVCIAPKGKCFTNRDCDEGSICLPDGICAIFVDPGDPRRPSGCALVGSTHAETSSNKNWWAVLALVGISTCVVRRKNRRENRPC